MATENIASFNRLNDSYFKYAIATEENKDLTIAFLNAAMRDLEPDGGAPLIEDVVFLDRESSPFREHAKAPRFDVLVKTAGGWTFHIEVQVAKEPFFLKRGFFYTVSDYFTQARRGMGYGELRPVIFIGLADFFLFGTLLRPRQWHTLHRILNVRTGEWQFQDVEFHIVELPVMRELLVYPETEFQRMLCYFGNIGGDELMEELAAQDHRIERLRQVEEIFRSDPMLWRNYIVQERAHIDYLATIKGNRAEARAEGEMRGRREEKLSTARRMREMGLTAEQISQATGLSAAEIEGL